MFLEVVKEEANPNVGLVDCENGPKKMWNIYLIKRGASRGCSCINCSRILDVV